ncbi:helix-turn-helix transcriptional regulator [bacterium]|nr:helix-turn-helix transcriptional regulator [bacterium]
MFDWDSSEEDKELKKIGLELMFLTPEKCTSTDGITAVELAKLVELPVETVKKKLKLLSAAEIIRVKGINPKYWKFDEYKFQRMNEDDPIYRLLCSFDDVDFDRYFDY